MPQTTNIEVVSPGLVLAGRFEVVNTIGVGSTGAVVEVIDRELDHERVALKLIHRHLLNDERRASRFRKEVLLVRQLSHPNIVRIFDFETSDDSTHFVSMELVRGLTLRSVLNGTPGQKLPFATALEVVVEVLTGLSYAHSRGVAHLDLKPENILLATSGLCKLADFGLGNALEDLEQQTRTGEIQGSPAYMAPEQFLGREVGPAADQYAVGVLAYELVSGQTPFQAHNFFEYARCHREDSADLSVLVESGAPSWFAEWIERALQKRPEDRYSSVDAMKSALEQQSPGSGNNAPLIAELVAGSGALEERSDLLRRIGLHVLWLSTILFLIFAAAFDKQMSARHGAEVLLFESHFGRPLTLFRALFRVGDISSLDPDSIFRAIARNDKHAIDVWCRSGQTNTKVDREGNNVVHLLAQAPALLPVAIPCLYPDLFDSQNRAGDTPLFTAVRAAAVETVSTLIQRGFDANVTDRDGRTVLEQAVASGNPLIVRALFPDQQKHPRLRVDKSGSSILGTAVRLQSVELVQELLNLGFDVEMRDADGASPLMIAAGIQSAEGAQLIQTLLVSGAQRAARDHKGQTAVQYAEAAGNTNGVTLLKVSAETPSASAEAP